MANLATVVTDCRMECTKVEFALHRMLFNAAQGDRAAVVQNIDEARRSLLLEYRHLRQLQRKLIDPSADRSGGR